MSHPSSEQHELLFPTFPHNLGSSSSSNRRQLPLNMKDKAVMTSNTRAELRGLIALYAYDQVMKLGEMKLADQQHELFKIFHGNEKQNRISHVSMLAQGEDMFSDLFEQDPDQPTKKRLRKIFYPSHHSIILGEQIKLAFLEQGTFNSKALVTGRTLLQLAKEHAKNIRKAMSFADKYLDKNTGEPKQSGNTVASVAEKILKDMWAIDKESNQGLNKITTEPGDDDVTEHEGHSSCEKPPRNWTFSGYTSFMFFGPFKENIEAKRMLDIFITKDPPSSHKKEYSRAFSRKKAAAMEKTLRTIDPNRGKNQFNNNSAKQKVAHVDGRLREIDH